MSHRPHTLEEFDLELQSLRGAVLSMGRLALGMVEEIGNLLETNILPDRDAAKALEKELDENESAVDEHARMIIIRFQPVATDLREVTGAVQIATDLEQIGDDARRILMGAEGLQAWIASDADKVLTDLWEISRRALDKGYHAFANREAKPAGEVAQSKRKVRKGATSARSQVAKRVSRNESLAPSFLAAVNAAHELERIGLHACSLAEAVFFIETSTVIRHGRKPGA